MWVNQLQGQEDQCVVGSSKVILGENSITVLVRLQGQEAAWLVQLKSRANMVASPAKPMPEKHNAASQVTFKPRG